MNHDQRFETPIQGQQFQSEYDLDSSMLIDLNQRDIAPLRVVTLDLSVAGSQYFNTAGRAFVPYFFVTGTTNKTQAPQGVVIAYVNEQSASNPNVALTCKHNRGFRGSYAQMFFTWGAQTGISVDLVFLRSKRMPWMMTGVGSSSSSGGPVVGGVAAESTNFTVNNLATFYPVTAGSAITATLPPGGTAAGPGQIAVITKVDSSGNAVTVTGGLLGNVVLNNQGDSISFYYSGAAWIPFA